MNLTVGELQQIVSNRLGQAVNAWVNEQNVKNGGNSNYFPGWGPQIKLDDAIDDMDAAWAELKKELKR